MGTIKLKYTKKSTDNGVMDVLSNADFQKFNSALLDLGDISQKGKYFEALAAIFDLESFTSFCNQIDPHLVIPEFMDEFVTWLFKSVSSEFIFREDETEKILWCPLPFFAKFLGDGVLFLWKTDTFDPADFGSVVASLLNICNDYRNEFVPRIRQSVSLPPKRLRCGIARGQIISVGQEKDFVGPCINVAARLQKLGQFSFAFARRGFNLSKYFDEGWSDEFVLIKSAIRGVGEEELVYVLTSEFEMLTPEEQKVLRP